MPFNKPYMFKQTNTVVIKHVNGQHIRVKPGDLGEVDHQGGKGGFAQWEADPQNGGNKCRFKSKKTGKYLRIKANKEIDVGGAGGKWTVFKVHGDRHKGSVKLESAEHNGCYIAVMKNNNKMKVGHGGGLCLLEISR
eukprot:UN01477